MILAVAALFGFAFVFWSMVLDHFANSAWRYERDDGRGDGIVQRVVSFLAGFPSLTLLLVTAARFFHWWTLLVMVAGYTVTFVMTMLLLRGDRERVAQRLFRMRLIVAPLAIILAIGTWAMFVLP